MAPSTSRGPRVEANCNSTRNGTILMVIACHVTNHLPSGVCSNRSLSVVVGSWGRTGVQLVTFALWEPKVRCPGFVLTLLLHLLRTCLCVQGSSDGAAGDDERDSEDGHLIYKSGDVIEDRCTSQVDHRVVASHGRSNLTAINLLFRPDRGHFGGGNLWEGGAVFGPQQVKRSVARVGDVLRCNTLSRPAAGGDQSL